jgi:hypothetical protein
MNHEHIKRQVQGYRDMQGLAYDEIDVHTLLGEAIETIEALSAENRVLWDTLEHIAKMTGDKYILGNATSLAQFAIESRNSPAPTRQATPVQELIDAKDDPDVVDAVIPDTGRYT